MHHERAAQVQRVWYQTHQPCSFTDLQHAQLGNLQRKPFNLGTDGRTCQPDTAVGCPCA